MVSALQRRYGADFLQSKGVSQRRCARLLERSRSSLRFRRKPLAADEMAECVQGLAHANPRYGYRRVWVLLRRQGCLVNRKRVHRLFKLLGLQVRRKPRKRIRTGQTVPMKATHPNHVWTYDFVKDNALNGDEIRCLTVTDEFTKQSLATDVEGHFPASKVQVTLDRLFRSHGRPSFIRSDNGPEFIAQSLKDWLVACGPQTFYIEPGSPWQNGIGESFNSKLRDECLNLEDFSSRAEARVIIEAWRREYNEARPHSSLGYLTPKEFRAAVDMAQLLGALPPDPRDLPPSAPPVALEPSKKTARAFPLAVTVRCVSTALGSLPSVALSSDEMTITLPSTPNPVGTLLPQDDPIHQILTL
jgi:putative transposase